MRKTWLFIAALLLSPGVKARAGEDPVREGIRLLREGKAARAYPLLAKEVAASRRAKKEPAPEVLFDLGLAALNCGKPEEARTAFMEALVGRGGKDSRLKAFSGWGLGSALWRLGEAAEKAGPAGLDQALKLVEGARKAWIRALLEDPSLDPLRRNIERANKKIEDLKKRKKEQEKKRKKEESKQKQKKKKKKKDESKEKKSKQEKKKKEERKKKEGRKNAGKKKDLSQRKKKAGRKKETGGKEKRKVAMSPEQIKKLMNKLKELEAERLKLERARIPARAKGGKGW